MSKFARIAAVLAASAAGLLFAVGPAGADPSNKNSATFTCDGLTLTTIQQNDAWSVQVVDSTSVFVLKSFTVDGVLVRDVPGSFAGHELTTCGGTFIGRTGIPHTFTATGFLT